MGYVAQHSEIPKEVENFFIQVKNQFQPKNQFHQDDRFLKMESYIFSFYGLKKTFHIFQHTEKILAIITDESNEFRLHMYCNKEQLNVWLDLLNYPPYENRNN